MKWTLINHDLDWKLYASGVLRLTVYTDGSFNLYDSNGFIRSGISVDEFNL